MFFFLLWAGLWFNTQAQFRFNGSLGPEWAGQTISLSLIENPLGSDRVYADQILLQTVVDSLGQFAFSGDFLPPTLRLYRIHASPCFDHGHQGEQKCRELEERIFVAHNQNQLKFQSYPEGGFLCQGIPPSSDLGLHAQDLRMALPFGDLAGLTETSRSLQFKQWLAEVEDFYSNCKDPLLTLYALGDVLVERSEYRAQLLTAGIPFYLIYRKSSNATIRIHPMSKVCLLSWQRHPPNPFRGTTSAGPCSFFLCFSGTAGVEKEPLLLFFRNSAPRNKPCLPTSQ